MPSEACVPLPTEPVVPSESKWRGIANQFLRYCVVGGIAFVIDYGTLLLGHYVLGMHYRLAAGLGFSLGLVVNYMISIFWVFDTRTQSNRVIEFLIFAGVGLLGLFVNDQVIFACMEMFGWTPGFSKLPATAIVLLLNFGLRKSLLFTKS